MRKTLALVFSLFGLFDSAYLWWVYTSPTHPLVCLGTGCDEVRASRFAFWGGVPTPAFGVAMYGALVILLLVEPFVNPKLGAVLRKVLFYLAAAGMVISLYLTSLEAFQIHAWCAWCVAQQVAIAIIFILLILDSNQVPLDDPQQVRRLAMRNVMVFVIALVVAVPSFAWLSHHANAEVKKQLETPANEGPPDLSRLLRPDSHSTGPADAPVTVVEFGDFQCPSCIIAEATNHEIRQRFPKQVRFVFREFPLAKFHQFAQKAAEAAECAGDQDKFWQMHDRLYQSDGELAVVQLKYYAQDIGLDTAKFNACLDSGSKAQRIQQDIEDGKALAVNATPTFYINQQKHIGGLNMQEFINTVSTAKPPTTADVAPVPATPMPVQERKMSESGNTVRKGPWKKVDLKPQETTAAAASSIVPGLAHTSANPLTPGKAASGDCDVNGTTGPQKNEIPTTTAQQMLKKGAVFVDIRSAKDFAKSHIAGAVNLPLEKISAGADTLPKNKPVVVYESGLATGDVCAASRAAAGVLTARGIKDVKVYHDGFAGWEKAGGAIQ